jgi:predicted ATPase
MRLSTARNLSRMYMMEPIGEVDAGWRETLALAEQVGDPDYQKRAIWGLFAGSFNSGNYQHALGLARRFRALADRADDKLIGDRLIGTAMHLLGDQVGARQHIERMLAAYVRPRHSSHIIRYQNDQLVAARRVLAPILWLLGYPEQAMKMVDEAVSEAVSLGQGMTLCNLLAQAACPLAVLNRDQALVSRYATMLLEQSSRYLLDAWHAYGRCFDGIARIRRGDISHGVPLVRNATDDLRRAGFTHNYTFHLSVLAEGLGRAGAIGPGLEAIETAFSVVDVTAERWCLPELLRIKGELLVRQTTDEASNAERQFREALHWATSHHVLAWELRSATSLARLLQEQGRIHEARHALAPVYDRFSEGFGTEDLKEARQLLDALA